MTYIKNVLVCMAAPLLVALLLLRRKQRPLLLFCLAGMGMCLLPPRLSAFTSFVPPASVPYAVARPPPCAARVRPIVSFPPFARMCV